MSDLREALARLDKETGCVHRLVLHGDGSGHVEGDEGTIARWVAEPEPSARALAEIDKYLKELSKTALRERADDAKRFIGSVYTIGPHDVQRANAIHTISDLMKAAGL